MSSVSKITMTLTVCGIPASTATARVLTTIFEKDVEDYKIETMDISKGAQKEAAYLAIQPFGVVPTLKDGDFVLYESRAICRYISDKYENQGTNLFPRETPQQKALVDQWLEVESQNFTPPVTSLVFNIVFGPAVYGVACDDTAVESSYAKLEAVLDIYEAHLAKGSLYLAGDSFSMADLSHLPWTHYLIALTNKGDGILKRKHVAAWWERITSRPSWKRMLVLQAQAKQS